MDDFFGRDGIFAKLFANTLEQMLEAELSDELGYEPHEASGLLFQFSMLFIGLFVYFGLQPSWREFHFR